jgi:hypothetical protein
MTFTSTTIRKLRALGLDQDTFDRVLEIFEEAKEAKPKKKGSAADRQERATRLPDDWALPEEWKQWALRIGLQPREVVREAISFKNYWSNCVGAKGMKLKWDLTWQTWCRRMLERSGRQPIEPDSNGGAAVPEGPQTFTDATWQAVARRYKSTGQWNRDWGPGPGEPGCRMPDKFRSRNLPVENEMGP